MTSRVRSWIPLVFAAWLAFAVINTTQVYISMLDHGHSYIRLLIYNVLVWSMWAVISIGIIHLSLRKPLIPFRTGHLLVHLLAALVVAVAHVAAWLAVMIVMKPYDAMTVDEFGANFAMIVYIYVQMEVFLYLIVTGVTHSVVFYARYVQREREAAKLEAELSRAQLETLELQLRPHFLFNTMNAIGTLVRAERNPEALEMLVRLSELLRETLVAGDSHEVSLERELQLFRKYLEIEKVRFSDRLSVEIDVADDVLSARVPPLILQPLAENAVHHGLARVDGPARLELRARRENGALQLDVFNSGPAISAGATRGVGLSNTARRLEQLYGAAASLQLLNRDDGVISRITIPFQSGSRS